MSDVASQMTICHLQHFNTHVSKCNKLAFAISMATAKRSRKGWDSNPRSENRIRIFETRAFNHSATLPKNCGLCISILGFTVQNSLDRIFYKIFMFYRYYYIIEQSPLSLFVYDIITGQVGFHRSSLEKL